MAFGRYGMCGTKDNLLWYALQGGSNKEEIVASLLAQKGYEQFSPSYRIDVSSRMKTRVTSKKLFPGYVFCRFDYGARNGVVGSGGGIVTTPGVVRILGGVRTTPVPTEEIVAIQLALLAGLKPEPGRAAIRRNGAFSLLMSYADYFFV